MTHFQRWITVTALAILALCLTSADAAAQAATAARFRISTVKDTTIVFTIASARWVKVGMGGRAVDPARSDEAVAQFRVLQVAGDSAEAVITGQTRPLIDAHVAVIEQPPRPFWRQRMFWLGSLLGVVIGTAAGASF